jgi:hypothetical protein
MGADNIVSCRRSGSARSSPHRALLLHTGPIRIGQLRRPPCGWRSLPHHERRARLEQLLGANIRACVWCGRAEITVGVARLGGHGDRGIEGVLAKLSELERGR